MIRRISFCCCLIAFLPLWITSLPCDAQLRSVLEPSVGANGQLVRIASATKLVPTLATDGFLSFGDQRHFSIGQSVDVSIKVANRTDQVFDQLRLIVTDNNQVVELPAGTNPVAEISGLQPGQVQPVIFRFTAKRTGTSNLQVRLVRLDNRGRQQLVEMEKLPIQIWPGGSRPAAPVTSRGRSLRR